MIYLSSGCTAALQQGPEQRRPGRGPQRGAVQRGPSAARRRRRFPGDDVPIVRGSALAALKGENPKLGRDAVLELMDAVDAYFVDPTRALDRPFAMPIEDVFSIQARNPHSDPHAARGARRKEGWRARAGRRPYGREALAARAQGRPLGAVTRVTGRGSVTLACRRWRARSGRGVCGL